MTPDPAGMAAANPTNPQSWNRYAYVMNNPLGYVDPLGLQPPCDDNPNTYCFYTGASACGPGQVLSRGMCVNISTVTGGNGCYVITEYGGGIGGVQCPGLQSPSQNNNCPPGVNCGSGQGGGSGQAGNAPDNGPHYSMPDICNASALLNNGLPTLLDAVGIIPLEGRVVKAAQFAAALFSTGLAIFGESTPTDAAFAGTSLGLSGIDNAHVMTSGEEVVPILGIGVSIAATIRDFHEMGNYYDDCMAGKN